MVSRLVEKLALQQFYDYFNNNKLLFSDQDGFRALHSSVSYIFKTTNDSYSVLDKMASGTADHSIICNKLRHYGVLRNDSNLIFSNRRRFWRVNGADSKLSPMNIGVPQGLGLGPLLFLVCINNFSRVVSQSSVAMFADDTSHSFPAKNLYQLNDILTLDLASLDD